MLELAPVGLGHSRTTHPSPRCMRPQDVPASPPKRGGLARVAAARSPAPRPGRGSGSGSVSGVGPTDSSSAAAPQPYRTFYKYNCYLAAPEADQQGPREQGTSASGGWPAAATAAARPRTARAAAAASVSAGQEFSQQEERSRMMVSSAVALGGSCDCEWL